MLLSLEDSFWSTETHNMILKRDLLQVQTLSFLEYQSDCEILKYYGFGKYVRIFDFQDLFTAEKAGLHRASKTYKFVKETKCRTPFLGVTMLVMARSCFVFQNTVQRVYYRHICAKQASNGSVCTEASIYGLLLCFSLFSFIISRRFF